MTWSCDGALCKVTVCGVVCVLQYCKGGVVWAWDFACLLSCLLHLTWCPFMADMFRGVSQISTLLRELHSFSYFSLNTGCSLVRSTDLQVRYRVFLGQKNRAKSKVQGVPWSEVPIYKQSTGCSLVRSTELQVKYRVFLGQKYRATSKV
jgi:hypothetical protein